VDAVPSGSPLLAAERRERLLSEVRRTGAVRASEFARTLWVSELTIRRDIAALAEAGRVLRVHGGATLADEPAGGVPRTGERPTLGMVVPSLEYYWPDVIAGARAAAADLGARIVLRGSAYDGGEGDRRQLSRLLHAGTIDGLLVAPASDSPVGARLLPWLESLAVPTVLMERRAPVDAGSHRLSWVTTDHALGADLAVRHLAAQGHARIGLLVSRGSPTSVHVAHGWRSACSALELDVDTKGLASTIDYPSHGRPVVDRALDHLLAAGVTALLVHSDHVALSVLRECAERGLDVPGDLAVVAYDDEVASTGQPPLTAVRPPREEIGRHAVELLLDRIVHGPERPVQRLQLVPSLVVRESSVRRGATPAPTARTAGGRAR
jgi:DNA-binding LacI/PurR family transcriptional regulator